MEVKELAKALHKRGFRATRRPGESTDYFTLTLPRLTFQDRKSEPTGVDNSVLGFKQTSGQTGVLDFEPTAKLLFWLAHEDEE